MTHVGIIKSNNIQYKEFELLHSNFTLDKIDDQLDEFIDMQKVTSNDDLMRCIIDYLLSDIQKNKNIDPNISSQFAIHTGIVKSVYNDMYQICHLYLTKELFEQAINAGIELKYNGICSYLTDMKLPIFGNAVIFKINTHNNNKLQNLTKNEINELYRQKFVHTGIVLKINGAIDETRYIFNPVDWISPSEISLYKYVEVEILNKILMIFYQQNEQHEKNPQNLNTIGTKLYDKLYGRLILGLRNNSNELTSFDDTTSNVIQYSELNKDTMEKIIEVFCNMNQTKKLAPNEDIDQEIVNGKRIYQNFHEILKKRLTHTIQNS